MITKDAPFSELRDQFFHYGVHRVFIVESEAVPKPCGVVSLHDFMYLFSSGGASQPSSA
jgi:CBS domain-containing protein